MLSSATARATTTAAPAEGVVGVSEGLVNTTTAAADATTATEAAVALKGICSGVGHAIVATMTSVSK